ncbi:MAG: hypothetical protein H7Y17_14945 [Chlorobia bacterium]|nr:hypothetical protein [Fimbriimonadaceae bacterium]
MRKRWVWIGAAATAGPPDGLDFIRKYGPQREYLTRVPKNRGVDNIRRMSSGDNWTIIFEFKSIPAHLDTDLKAMSNLPKDYSPVGFTLPDRRHGAMYPSEIIIYDAVEPSWLSLQWQALMNRISPPATK